MAEAFALEGGCACGSVRYRVTRAPLIVHCCHCRSCQRETGSAFVLNALVESASVELLEGPTAPTTVPTASGKGQVIHRCPSCHVAIYSLYLNFAAGVSFVRTGTLDVPETLAPDVHIHTSAKLPWVALPDGVAAWPEFYRPKETWSADTLARIRALRAAEGG